MALIQCPNCGKQISDKAIKCIYCGSIINEEQVKEKRCLECGNIITDDMDACQTCGCPIEKFKKEETQKVEVTNVKITMNKKNRKKIISIATVVLLVIIALMGFKVGYDNNIKKEYVKNYEKTLNLMLNGAADAESICTLIHDTWSNTIFKEESSKTNQYTKDDNGNFYDDFNTSLEMLMVSDDFTSDLNAIEKNQEEVQGLMKEMKNVPKDYEDEYVALKNFYNSYTKLVNLAVNPSGNLENYTSNFNEADSDTLNSYKEALLYIED